LLHLDRIVARVEDEQRDAPFLSEPTEQSLYLPCGDPVGVLHGMDAQCVNRSSPALADEVELGDELVGPARYDGLASRVAGRMVIETTLGTAPRIAAIPHAHVHSIDGRLASSKRMVSEQPPQSLGVDSSMAERVVETAPSTAMRRLQAQVDWRRDLLGAEEGIGEFEEGVSAAMEAVVE
jgi:hypothetical protein